MQRNRLFGLSITTMLTTFVLIGIFVQVAVAQGVVLLPAQYKQFFVLPGEEAIFEFRAVLPAGESGVVSADAIPYRYLAENGTELATGTATIEGDFLRVTLVPVCGYSELEFPTIDQKEVIQLLPRMASWMPPPAKADSAKEEINAIVPLRLGIMGIAALPESKRDPFFCIDGALSWLVQSPQMQQDYIDIAARSGIVTIRERLSWREIEPEQSVFRWKARRDYESVRNMIHEAGLTVLELTHDAPKFYGQGGLTGEEGLFPGDLVQAADAWGTITDHWGHSWCGFEIWNEPDILFSGDLPSDQYVPLVQALTWKLRRHGVDFPLIGGSLAHCNKQWIETANFGQMFELLDGFSFHTYALADGIANLYDDYTATALAVKPDLSFWLTECGRPWDLGPPRPPRDQDLRSACDIVMKGVEAKASVVDYYFPFVYPYYEEGSQNFAMMSQFGAPIRAMAAYVVMASFLSGWTGELPLATEWFADRASDRRLFDVTTGKPIKRLLAFHPKTENPTDTISDSQSDEMPVILVCYNGDASQDTTLQLKTGRNKKAGSGISAQSLTGEPLAISEEGTVTFSGGLVYLFGLRSDFGLEKPVVRNRNLTPIEAKVSPIAAIWQFDPEVVTTTGSGYRLKAPVDDPISIRLRIWNFDDKTRTVRFVPLSSGSLLELAPGESETIQLPPRGFVEQTVKASINDELALNKTVKLQLEYRLEDTAGDAPGSFPEVDSARVQLVITGEIPWEKIRLLHPDAVEIPISEADRWTPNASSNGTTTMTTDSPDSKWKLSMTFTPADRWAYPYFTLPEGVDLSKYKGIMIRAKCSDESSRPNLMLFREGVNSGYFTPDKLFLGDGKWHSVEVPFDSLVHCVATGPDPLGTLAPEKVKKISIGLNTQADDVLLEVSDCWLY